MQALVSDRKQVSLFGFQGADSDPMSEDRILNFVVRRLDDKTGFQTYRSGKKDDSYDICRVEVLAEIRVVD